MPPVEDRVRKPCAPSTRTRSSGRGSHRREYLVGESDAERDGAGFDAELDAPSPDPLLLTRVGSHGLVHSATRREHDRARPGAGLEGRPAGLDAALEPLERRPRESPVLAVSVQARWRRRSASVIGVPLTAPLCARPWRPVARRLRRWMARPRALITGVGGQDGLLLAALLLEQGYRVVGVVRRDPSACTRSGRSRDGPRSSRPTSSTTRRLPPRCARRARTRSTIPRALSFVPRSWDEPILTAEFRGGRRDVDARGDP